MSRVLVVDDEPQILRALRVNLHARQHAVTTAGSGAEALAAAAAQPPDIVVLDLGLPDMDGVTVIRELRSWTSVPIIVLSGRSGSQDKVEALDAGADDYVTKPFSFRELLARIRALLRRTEQQALAPELETVDLGQVRVDMAGHRLLRGGEVLPVKPKVFELLLFLLRNAGHVFTRDQLLEQVWGYDYAGETRTVDVHIHWLRAQIEADPANPVYLETVRGVGYVLRRPEGD